MGAPGSKDRLSPKRRRMRKIVARFQAYVVTYTAQEHYDTYSDRCFIDDMLYGIGLAMDQGKHSTAPGYARWKEKLREHLK